MEATNDGYAAGINRGVAALSPGLPVLVLNPDVVLAPGSVQPLLDRLDDPGVGIVAPRMLDGDGALTPSLRRRPTLLRSLGLGFTVAFAVRTGFQARKPGYSLLPADRTINVPLEREVMFSGQRMIALPLVMR